MMFRATPLGRQALEAAKVKIRELFAELMKTIEEIRTRIGAIPKGPRGRSPRSPTAFRNPEPAPSHFLELALRDFENRF
jgi:hypothetical protein